MMAMKHQRTRDRMTLSHCHGKVPTLALMRNFHGSETVTGKIEIEIEIVTVIVTEIEKENGRGTGHAIEQGKGTEMLTAEREVAIGAATGHQIEIGMIVGGMNGIETETRPEIEVIVAHKTTAEQYLVSVIGTVIPSGTVREGAGTGPRGGSVTMTEIITGRPIHGVIAHLMITIALVRTEVIESGSSEMARGTETVTETGVLFTEETGRNATETKFPPVESGQELLLIHLMYLTKGLTLLLRRSPSILLPCFLLQRSPRKVRQCTNQTSWEQFDFSSIGVCVVLRFILTSINHMWFFVCRRCFTSSYCCPIWLYLPWRCRVNIRRGNSGSGSRC